MGHQTNCPLVGSLDELDNDPLRFWIFIVAACSKLIARYWGSDAGDAALNPKHLLEARLTPLINELQSNRINSALDDYQFDHDPTIHNALSLLPAWSIYLLKYI